MRLDPPPKHTMRVHELAKELGWPPARLVDELRRRGEWVKSAMSTIEAPVVRAIRRDFAAADPPADPEHSLDATFYGNSADPAMPSEPPGETFAEALARVKADTSRRQKSATSKNDRWRPPIRQALLDEVIALRPEHLHPNGECFGWEQKKAEKMHVQWTAARLDGLAGEDLTVVGWIRLSGGQQPHLAAELSSAGITPEEAALHLGYGGRIDPRMDTLYTRFRDRRISRSEVIAAVRQWRRNNAAG
jgi:Translation initiation factor IF-2, N-terminal region